MGYKASPGGVESITMGKQASTQSNYSIAIGSGAKTYKVNNIALGSGSKDKEADNDTYGQGIGFGGSTVSSAKGVTWSTSANNVVHVLSLGSGTTGSGDVTTRRIVNVTAGRDDTDAVNVAQLKSLASNKISLAGDSGTGTSVELGAVNNGGLAAASDVNTRLQFGIKGWTPTTSTATTGTPAAGTTTTTTSTTQAEVQSIETTANDKNVFIKVKDGGITEAKLSQDVKDKLNANVITKGTVTVNNGITKTGTGQVVGGDLTLSLDFASAVDKQNGNENKVVSAGQVKDALDLKANKNADNITTTNWVTKLSTGASLTAPTGVLVTDTAVKSALDDKANKNLGNIDATGENKIKDEAIKAVKVAVTGNGLTLNTTSDESTTHEKTYTLSLDFANAIDKDGNANKPVSAGQVADALAGKVNTSDLNTTLGGYTKIDGTNLTNIAKDKWAEALGNGTIGGNTDSNLVTGSTVKTALNNKLDTTKAKFKIKGDDTTTKEIDLNVATPPNVEINGDNTTIEVKLENDKLNVKAKTGEVADNVTTLVTGSKVKSYVDTALSSYAKLDGSNLTATGGTGGLNVTNWATALGTGTVAANDENLVKGKTVKTAIDDLTLKYKANDTGNDTVKLTDGLNFKGTANQITATASANGVVTYALDNAVTNKLNLIDTTKGIADKDLSNVSPAGKTVIQNIAKDAVKLESGKNTTVSSTVDADLNTVYTVDVNSDLEDINSIKNSDGTTTLNITDGGLTLNDKKIDGLAEATLSSTSTEAVSGKQLVAKAKEIADALGGGATVSDDNGAFTQPTYKLKTKVDGSLGTTAGATADGGNGGTYNNVGAALTAIDNAVDKVANSGLNFAGDTATTTQTAKLTKKVQITGGTQENDRVITSSVASDNADGVIVTLGIDTGKLTTKLGTGTIDDKATKSNLVTGATVKEYVDNAINNVTGTSGLGNKADKDAGNLVTTPAGGGAKTSALDDTAKANWATALGNGTIGNGDTGNGGKTTDNNLVTGKVVNDAIEAAKTAMINKGFNVVGSAGGDGINTKLGAKVQIKGKDQNIAKASATAENVALITAEATSDSANGSVVSLSLNTDKLGQALVNNTTAAQSLKDNLTLGYKVNGNNAQTTSLTTGLDFYAGTGNNISDSTGVITNSGSAKAGITILNGKDGKVIIGLSEATETTLKQVTTNKDSINNITNEINTLREGSASPMVYTTEDGTKVTKINNKFYKTADVQGKRYDATSGKFYDNSQFTPDGKLKENPTELPQQPTELTSPKVVISAVNPNSTTPTTDAMKLNNVSGLTNGKTSVDFTSDTAGKNTSLKVTNKYQDPQGNDQTSEIEIGNKGKITGVNSGMDTVAELISAVDTTKDGKETLGTVATLKDVQTIAKAGINFKDGQANTVNNNTINAQLGNTVIIKGKDDTTYNGTNYSAENLVTHVDQTAKTITIAMLKTPKFDALNLGDVKLTPSTDGGKLTLSNTKQGATDTKVVLDGLKEGTTRDAAATKGSVEDVTTDLNKVKDALGLNGVDGTNGQTSTGPAGKDGLDGKSILDKVQAGRDGLSGSMVYTDKDGNRIDKVGDKYYKDSDVKDALTTANVKLADDGKYYPSNEVDSNGKHTGQTAGKSLQDVLNDQGKEEVPTTNMQVSAVNPNGSTTTPTAIGNVASGLGLDNVKGTTSTAITEAKAKEAVAGTNGLLTKSGKDLNNVATVGDLQALAQAGLDITDGQPTAIKNNVAHLPLGTKLKIQGKADTTADNSYSSDNLATMVDSTNKTVTISMLKTPKFDGINLKDVSLTPSDNGSTLNLSNTKDPNATDKGVVITGIKDGETDDSAVSKKALDEVKNSITSVAQDAVKLEDGKNTTVNSTLDHNLNVTYTVDVNSNLEDIDSITNSDGSTTLDITDKGLTLNDKKITGLAEGTDTQDAVNFGQLDKVQKDVDKVKDALGLNGTDGTNGTTGSTGPAGKDGLNGSSIVDKVEAGRNGLTGTMVYTNEAGDRLSAVDGKYYKASDLQGKRYDPATKKFYAEDQFDANGTLKQNPTELAKQPAEVATDDIVISAVKPDGSTTDGSKLNNVASIKNGSTTAELGTDGLKVTVTGQDPIVIGKAGQITGLKSGMTSVDDLLAKNPNSDTDKPILGTAATLGDVQKLAQAGFKLAGDDSTSKATPETVQLTKKITVTGASQKIGTSTTDKAQVITSAVTKDGNNGDVKVELTLDTTNLAKAILNGIDGTNGNDGATGGTGNTGGTGTGGDAGTPGAGGTGGNTGAGGTGTGTNGTNGQDGKSILEGGLNLGYKVNSGTQEKTTLAKGLDFISGDGTEKSNTDNSKINESAKAQKGIKIVAGKDGKIIIGLDETTKKAIDTVAGTTNGIDGTTGPSGKDGQNGKTLAQKVQAGRDGLTGSMVYTDKNGNRLEKAGDNYYKAEEIAAAGLKQANDGKYYNSSDVEADGTPKANASSVDVDQKMTEAGKTAVDPKDMQVSAVNPDGSTTTTTAIGNVASGLGLDNVKGATPTAITEAKAKEAIAGTDGQSGLLTAKGKDLTKVATVGDLQAVAQAGIDFSDAQTTAKVVHRPLGSKLVIQGKANTDYDAQTYSADNLVTLADTAAKTITISMLKTPKFDAVELGNVKLTPNADGSKLTLSNTTTNPAPADTKVVLDGVKEGITADSVATKGSVDDIKKALGLDGTNGTNGTGTQGSTGPAGKDGLDGKTIMEQIQAGRDGLSGNMVYTNTDGDRLEKVGEKYYKAEDVQNAIKDSTLKQAKDGKFYPANDVNEKGEHTGTGQGKTLSEVLTEQNKTEVQTKDIKISAINPDGTAKTPTIIGNVADGVKDNDAVNVKQLNALKSSLTDTGLTFSNGTIEKTTKLGKKVTIKGGTGNSEYITSTITQDNDGNTSFELGINTANLTTALGTGTIGSGDTNNGGKATDKNLVTGTTVNTAINNAKEELQNAIDKVQGQIGPQGATGIDGTNGTSGKDGQNGKTLGQKVQAGRDGLTGSMVYTDDNGTRLEKVGDDYFKASDIQAAGLKQANDGKYYQSNEVDNNGNPVQNANPVTDVKAELKKSQKDPVATKDIRITAVNPDGSTTAPTKIGNVADGVNKNDAVNKGQLDALKSSIEDGTIVGKMSYKVNDNPATATKADFLNFVAGDGEKTTSEDAQKGIVIVDGGAGKVIIGLDKETREKINAIDQNIVEKGVADKDLSNISTNGKTVVKNLAKEAVKVAAGANVTVTPTEADDNITYTVAVNKDLKGITSITNGDDTTEGTKITLSNDGVSLNDKKITGLANGDVTKDSTDAINGSQLYNSNKEISLALGAGFNQATGQIEEPEYKLKAKDGKAGEDTTTYNNVKAALNALDSVVANNYDKVTNTASTDPEKFAEDSELGKITTVESVKNFFDYRLEDYSKNVNSAFEKFGQTIQNVDLHASAGVASAMAASQIPQVQNSTDNNVVGIGFGAFRGQKAMAMGISGMNDRKTAIYKVALTYDSQRSVGVSAGLGFSFGKGRGKLDLDLNKNSQLGQKLQEQEQVINQLQSERITQDQQIEKLQEQNETLQKQNEDFAKRIEALEKYILNK